MQYRDEARSVSSVTLQKISGILYDHIWFYNLRMWESPNTDAAVLFNGKVLLAHQYVRYLTDIGVSSRLVRSPARFSS